MVEKSLSEGSLSPICVENTAPHSTSQNENAAKFANRPLGQKLGPAFFAGFVSNRISAAGFERIKSAPGSHEARFAKMRHFSTDIAARVNNAASNRFA
ncbi:MAG: hypothetical protein ACR2PF_18535 [Rhizobiaceae bacterium]